MKMYPINSMKYIYSFNLHDIFPNRICDDQNIISYFHGKADSSRNDYGSNINGWRTDWDAHTKYPLLSELISNIKTIIFSMGHPYVENNGENVFLKESWIHVQRGMSKDFVEPHSHGNMGLSFTYYLKVEELGSHFRTHCLSAPTFSGSQIITKNEIKTTNGELLIFDPELIHDVPPSNFDRIVYAGNILILPYMENFSVRLMDF